MERDRRIDAELKTWGWRVLRFWETDIREDIGKPVEEIEGLLHQG